ncbi:CCE_0567 family metalloprotein [Roseibium litorale]|uniref:Rop-like n=1 Tax=Roseibium litorale TaxID=2803841 RepID=A0ABR9CR76_9HYPH|nr:CCE_0567 family metalloprotein [Roseibium litorale]MBD8893332.1 hypothetical protein [Roseibium litorale]
MNDVETLKAEVKKLSSRATALKMDLHDLAEDLPVNWQSIMNVAQETYSTYQALESKRAELKQLEA